MDEYLALEIKNHPAISSEYVKFLSAHSAYKEIQVLKKKLETAEKRLTDIEKTFKKLPDSAKSKP